MIEVREARNEDVEEILNLWDEFTKQLMIMEPDFFKLKNNARNVYRKLLKRYLIDQDYLILVAEAGGKLVGYHITSVRYPPEVFVQIPYGHISDLYLQPEYRSLQVGQLMVEYSKEWLKQNGVTKVDVKTFLYNEKGRKFWEKNGFRTYETAFKCSLEKKLRY